MADGPVLRFGKLDFPLNKVTNSVGRKDRITNLVPDVDLGTLDQERSVSRRHAELTYDRGVVSLRDVGSTNGSTVNGERLAHQVDRPLNDGDEVGFGAVTMTFAQVAEWPEGVEAEWPPDQPETAPEETMIAGPGPEETMISGPQAEETMVAGPGSSFGIGDAPAELPAATLEEPAVEEVAPEPEPEPEPEPVTAAAAPEPEPVEAYTACANHSHLPAVGLCPGCLEPFCVDCLPEREDGLMVCNRCAGISYRLTVAVQAVPAPSAAAASFQSPVAAGAHGPASSPGLPTPPALPAPASMPAPAPIPGPTGGDGDKKKRWPF